MCGIAGFLLKSDIVAPEQVLKSMTDTISHRGPDGSGHWFDGDSGVGLGHRRLAIVDLSETGRQPMCSRSGRYTTVFNGEIYNFQSLREELAATGATFRGRSDTEVMLAAMEAWGVERATERLAGMFAIALWDSVDRNLYLIRDRLGKKPVYYGVIGGGFVFGSELKALRAFPSFDAAVNRDALALYLRHNYVPGPWSIYEGISKLPPASILKVTVKAGAIQVGLPTAFWSIKRHQAAGVVDEGTPDDRAIDQLDTLLRDAVRLRMIADVPLGAFLSGGIDSSVVVALMQAQSARPIETFTIGFHEALYDEAPHARSVASHLKTNHTEVYVTAAEARAVIPLLPRIFDEPFSDSSQIPTYLVSQIARRSVTVALSGDGGDELFCGYSRYTKWRALWRKFRRMPPSLQRMVAWGIDSVPAGGWNAMLNPFLRLLPGQNYRSAGEKLQKLSQVLRTNDPAMLYLGLISHWMRPESVVIGATEPATMLNSPGGPRDIDLFTDEMMRRDLVTYLPDDILAKVDRASMAVSLESRAPLLDHRLVEFAMGLPLALKLRGGTTKWVLRQVLERYVPAHLFERPKMGFGVPIDSWLRGPLREWAEDLLSESRMRQDGYFQPGPIRQLWHDHLAGRTEAHYALWDILMFQAWLRDVHGKHLTAAAA